MEVALVKRIVSQRYTLLWNSAFRASSIGHGSVGSQERDPFKLLGVSSTANEQQIRDAFRQAAKKCHPDMHKHPAAEEQFRRCLVAYQTLISKVSRQLPAGASRTANTPIKEAMLQQLRWVDSFRRASDGLGAEAAVAQRHAELWSMQQVAEQVHESVQQAYCGPSLEGLQEGALPAAFEAEHRSCASRGGDLLQIVSGATLLGSVRCCGQALLPGANNSHHLSASAKQHKPQDASATSPARHPPLPAVPHTPSIWDAITEATLCCDGAAEPCGLPGGVWAGTSPPSHCPPPHQHSPDTQPQVNELMFSVGNMDQVKATRHMHQEMEWLEMRCAVTDQLLGYVFGDTITDPQGRATHKLVKINTPGGVTVQRSCSVLKTYIMAVATGQVAVKASRTWLPDHSYWFVPPRSIEYSTGGWYVEQAALQPNRRRRAALHPGVVCCLLGFQALEFEAGVDVPWWLKRTLQAAQRDVRLLPA